jgi:hypothetical protein
MVSARGALAVVLLTACYASHSPWERAAPDATALSMRVELSGPRGIGPGFLEIRFDGTYVAAPTNDLRVCTGVLDDAELGAWSSLIERTRAFDRVGIQGDTIIDGGITEVVLTSEGGLSTYFLLQGGASLAGYDPALSEFAVRTEALWATLDFDECPPETLDPAATSVRAWFNPWDDGRTGSIEVLGDGSVSGFFGRSWLDTMEREPCAPLADRAPLLALAAAAAPFDPSWDDDIAVRDVGVHVGTLVAAAGANHERRAYTLIHLSRPEHARLGAAVETLAETHCRP